MATVIDDDVDSTFPGGLQEALQDAGVSHEYSHEADETQAAIIPHTQTENFGVWDLVPADETVMLDFDKQKYVHSSIGEHGLIRQ